MIGSDLAVNSSRDSDSDLIQFKMRKMWNFSATLGRPSEEERERRRYIREMQQLQQLQQQQQNPDRNTLKSLKRKEKNKKANKSYLPDEEPVNPTLSHARIYSSEQAVNPVQKRYTEPVKFREKSSSRQQKMNWRQSQILDGGPISFDSEEVNLNSLPQVKMRGRSNLSRRNDAWRQTEYLDYGSQTLANNRDRKWNNRRFTMAVDADDAVLDFPELSFQNAAVNFTESRHNHRNSHGFNPADRHRSKSSNFLNFGDHLDPGSSFTLGHRGQLSASTHKLRFLDQKQEEEEEDAWKINTSNHESADFGKISGGNLTSSSELSSSSAAIENNNNNNSKQMIVVKMLAKNLANSNSNTTPRKKRTNKNTSNSLASTGEGTSGSSSKDDEFENYR